MRRQRVVRWAAAVLGLVVFIGMAGTRGLCSMSPPPAPAEGADSMRSNAAHDCCQKGLGTPAPACCTSGVSALPPGGIAMRTATPLPLVTARSPAEGREPRTLTFAAAAAPTDPEHSPPGHSVLRT